MTGDELIAKLQALTPEDRVLPVCVMGGDEDYHEAANVEVKSNPVYDWHDPELPKRYIRIL